MGDPKEDEGVQFFLFFGGLSREIGVGDIRYGLSSINPFLPPSPSFHISSRRSFLLEKVAVPSFSLH